jgi:hypothetical protein
MDGPAQAVLLHGGARSGKSWLIVAKIIDRAQKFPGSRHLIARYRLAHAKSSIWHETVLPLVRGQPGWHLNFSDLCATFKNGSEIWLGGFDDPDRVEKILGHEYATIYPNEVSQISYEAFTMARSRLAQNIPGLINKAYLDCNPPSPQHWSHRMFFEHVEPRSGKPLERPELYAQIQMNPADNEKNLPSNYISDILGQLPDREKRRFRDGEWVKPEGTIFYAFNEGMIVEEDDIPPKENFEEFTVGVDFGMNFAAVLVGWMGDTIWFLDDWGAFNMTAGAADAQLRERWEQEWGPWGVAYCDPSGGERIQEISAGDKADNTVEDGINWLNQKMERGEFKVTRRAAGWLGEAYDYRRDEKGRVVKQNDHFCDAARYGSYSRAGKGVLLYV